MGVFLENEGGKEKEKERTGNRKKKKQEMEKKNDTEEKMGEESCAPLEWVGRCCPSSSTTRLAGRRAVSLQRAGKIFMSFHWRNISFQADFACT